MSTSIIITDLTNPIAQVRQIAGNPDASIIGDDGITFYLQQQGDVTLSAVEVLRYISRYYAMKPKEQMGDYSIDYTAQSKAAASAADTLATQIGDEADDPQIGEAGGAWFGYGLF